MQHSREKRINGKHVLARLTANINVTQNVTTLKTLLHKYVPFFYSIGSVVLKMSIKDCDNLLLCWGFIFFFLF